MFSVEAAEDVVLGGPLHVIADEEVEQAVAIVIEPEGRGAEAEAVAESALGGDVDECAFAGVAKEAVLADAGDENVGKAVVVVIADGDAHAVHFNVETGAMGDVGEGAVAIIAIEAECGALAFVPRPVHAIDQQDVLPAVGVVIEERAS